MNYLIFFTIIIISVLWLQINCTGMGTTYTSTDLIYCRFYNVSMCIDSNTDFKFIENRYIDDLIL